MGTHRPPANTAGNPIRGAIVVAILCTTAACAGSSASGGNGERLFDYKEGGRAGMASPMPDWVRRVSLGSDKLCGIGVAGAGFTADSPYPKRLSEDRAVYNLAGVLGTRVQEAIIDRALNERQSIRTARALTIDDMLIEQVRNLAITEFWLDVAGQGPYASKSFTYAHTCIDAKVAAAALKIDASKLKAGKSSVAVGPGSVPGWIDNHGLQPGGRLCAVGFSLPTFHPDKTFQGVVEDIRGQLATVIQTLVSSYYEELTTTRGQTIEAMTVATTEAISKGAIVTDYWYDRDGIGSYGRKRSTYGWGCVYPVDIVMSTVAAVEKVAPEDEKHVIAKVRERAQNAFADLDAEIDKRESAPSSPATATPSAQPSGTPAAIVPAEPTRVEEHPALDQLEASDIPAPVERAPAELPPAATGAS